MLTSVSAQRNARDSPLLRFAPELRNGIWAFVCAGHEIKIDEALEMWIGSAEYAIETSHQTVCDTDNHPEDQLYYDSAPDLCFLLVCRQIYAEAVLLPFSMNRFSFECFDYTHTRGSKTLYVRLRGMPLNTYTLGATITVTYAS
jgi:hypothetical protein